VRSTALKRALFVILPLAVIATVGKAILNAASDDFKGYGETESWSVADARDRGVLVAELTAVPNELSVPGGRVRVGEVWVEERALTTHRLVWLPHERRVGGYRLHFSLSEGRELKDAAKLMFVCDGHRGSSVGGNASSDGRFVYIERLDSADVSDLRIGLVPSFDSPPGETIRFVPK
jgi:hypothetical protein